MDEVAGLHDSLRKMMAAHEELAAKITDPFVSAWIRRRHLQILAATCFAASIADVAVHGGYAHSVPTGLFHTQ